MVCTRFTTVCGTACTTVCTRSVAEPYVLVTACRPPHHLTSTHKRNCQQAPHTHTHGVVVVAVAVVVVVGVAPLLALSLLLLLRGRSYYQCWCVPRWVVELIIFWDRFGGPIRN